MIGIGTELAITAICGNDGKRPINSYDSLVINIDTIIRNMLQSYDKDEQLNLEPSEVSNNLTEEIKSLVETVSSVKSNIKVFIYCCSYKGLSKKHELIQLKEHFTDNQKRIYKFINTTRELFFKSMADSKITHEHLGLAGPIGKFNVDITFNNAGRVLLLTHMFVDVMSKYSFDSMDLLESYTGSIKKQSQWYKKINIKLNKPIKVTWLLIAIFGDGNDLIRRMSPSIHKGFYALATEKKWDMLTTESRMKDNIKGAPDTKVYSNLSAIFLPKHLLKKKLFNKRAIKK